MGQIIIHLETPEIQALEKQGDKNAIAKVKQVSALKFLWMVNDVVHILSIRSSFSNYVNKMVAFNHFKILMRSSYYLELICQLIRINDW